MNVRQRIKAILAYEDYDRLPIVHFGFWRETLEKWAEEGHITARHAADWSDSSPSDRAVSDKLGFDSNWANTYTPATGLFPAFEEKVLKVRDDGSEEVFNSNGMVVLRKKDAGSIPAEIDYTLKGRRQWEQGYLPRLQFSIERVIRDVNDTKQFLPFDQGGLDYLKDDNRSEFVGLFCGSLFGQIRNWVGVEAISYLYMDDEKLFDEIIDTVGRLCFKVVRSVLETGAEFDFGHFWEDICFKNGPLVIPSVFYQKVGPYYKRITDLLKQYGVEIVSLDCDGLIDSLIPAWFENGVNTMFPIEVGTWKASIKPWREKYGKELRGVGGMNKVVFSRDFAAVDAEVERLKPLVDLGGYIPCPDHRIAPDAKWDNVRYYCDRMRQIFG